MRYYVFIIILVLIISCDSINVEDSEELTLATFNIAWLGDGKNDIIERSESDYEILADIISDTNIDLWALQEIENADALKIITDHLDGYSSFVGTHGGNQNLAFLFKNSIDINSIEENMSISVEPGTTRPGLTCFVSKGNLDLMVMNVHFKSTSRYDDTDEKRQRSIRLRTEQAVAASIWADSILSSGIDQDIIILGDYNDYPLRKNDNTLEVLLNNPNYDFITSHIMSCKFDYLNSIDNILVSNSINDRYLLNSAKILNIRDGFTDDELEMISDHCPVTAKFEIVSPDND